ncbi:MAG: hypothetical protein M5U34_36535 [Chloroflexi bacterium]|nr:hypothetical protein [Chloroflexota bacterium]
MESLGEGLDRIDFVIVYTILQQLAGEAPPAAEIGSVSETEPISAASAIPAEVREAWGPVVGAVAAAAQGNTQAAAQVEPVLQKPARPAPNGRRWRVLRRILAGERDTALLADLDETDTLIAGNVLRGLGVAGLEGLPGLELEQSESKRSQSQSERGDEEQAGAFLNSLLAGGGDGGAG